MTRDDITVERIDTGFRIDCKLPDTSYGVSFTEDAVVPAIQNLSEMIMKKVVGITEHDISMKFADFIINERQE